MDDTHSSLHSPAYSSPVLLHVDFSWRKSEARVTKDDNPSDPIYLVSIKLTSPNLIFKSPTSSGPIGTGNIHAVSISPDYEIRGQKGTLKAMKRFKTQYTYQSHAFSDDDDCPVPMTWEGDCGFKNWDFVCMDQYQMPVAKLSVNMWAVKKLATIELMGPKATSRDAWDEVIVTGLTLFCCMEYRSQSTVSFFAALFSRPGSS